MYNKMKRSSLYIILIAFFLIQLLFLDHLKIMHAKPDLLVLMVVFFAIFFGPGIGLEAGFASGLLKDMYSVDIFGVNIILLSLVGLIVGMLSPKLFKESKLTQGILIFASSGIYMIVHYFASSLILKTTYAALPDYLYSLILPSSIYTAVLSIILFPILIDRYHLKENAEYL
ncbi:MAG: rod shape-determining protein MreD [Candidatus Omnitrophota bacterium]|nr:rod shape-determining protein MreD [Candidatus Omnitrophota bacterium]